MLKQNIASNSEVSRNQVYGRVNMGSPVNSMSNSVTNISKNTLRNKSVVGANSKRYGQRGQYTYNR